MCAGQTAMTKLSRLGILSFPILLLVIVVLTYWTYHGGRSKLPVGPSKPAVALGESHGLILASDGSLWSWGAEEGGWPVLGLGKVGAQRCLRRIGNDTNWVSIAAGFYHNLGVKSDGSMWAWGGNHRYQLGDGTTVSRMPECDDAHLARLLGLDRVEDFAEAEQETPELLVRVSVNEAAATTLSPAADTAIEWFGHANRLSHFHVEWPVIDEAIAASERKAASAKQSESGKLLAWPPPSPPACSHSAGQLIRQRRSAVDFDGVSSISRETFLSILDTTLPRTFAPPFDAWPFPPRLHLVLMVHRVTGLDPGLYLWLRAPADADALRRAFGTNLNWEAVTDSAITAPLYRLGRGDLRDFARTLSCHQDIAADGAFSLGMLARFEPVLRERGAAAYRELFWEAGMIGQALYLAAEAAGVRGTGIGCYFDEVLHRALGLAGHDWQSLYHFTIGGPVEDLRLRTVPPYPHLAADTP